MILLKNHNYKSLHKSQNWSQLRIYLCSFAQYWLQKLHFWTYKY
jgi:hypothetical protein